METEFDKYVNPLSTYPFEDKRDAITAKEKAELKKIKDRQVKQQETIKK